MLDEDGASNNGHKHTLTDPEHRHTGTTDTSLIGITATNTTGTAGGAQHENTPPYLVVNYIILAKHPTF
jgi:microcystin-dependent protein